MGGARPVLLFTLLLRIGPVRPRSPPLWRNRVGPLPVFVTFRGLFCFLVLLGHILQTVRRCPTRWFPLLFLITRFHLVLFLVPQPVVRLSGRRGLILSKFLLLITLKLFVLGVLLNSVPRRHTFLKTFQPWRPLPRGQFLFLRRVEWRLWRLFPSGWGRLIDLMKLLFSEITWRRRGRRRPLVRPPCRLVP